MIDQSTLDLNDYLLQDKIGSGSFGQVFKVKDKNSGVVYAAKISHRPLEDSSDQEIRNLSREISILSKLNHPAIMKFIGFSSENFQHDPCPVIITELVSNGTLLDVINLERKSMGLPEWNDTRKLINIYGIASAMSYMHLHNIIHRDLKPANILMDDFLCPKVADFGLSKVVHSTESMSVVQSTRAIKGTPIYIAPEVWAKMDYSPACDVYAYGIIVYEIITGQEPYEAKSFYEIFTKISAGERPRIDNLVPLSYKNLIESCWSQNPDDRPTFEAIVNGIKESKDFITENVNENDFLEYVNFIDSCKTEFGPKKIVEFIGHETETFQRIKINELEEKSTTKKEKEKEKFMIFPSKLLKKLPKECQDLVQEAADDPEKMFEVGENLIEGSGNFVRNTELGIKYIEKSANEGCIDSVTYLGRLLIEDEVIPQDLDKAKSILEKNLESGNSDVLLLYGKTLKKEKDYENAKKYFEKSAKSGNAEAMYELGKLSYKGLGCEQNEKEALKLFSMSKKNGFNKIDNFLSKQSDKIPTDKKERFEYFKSLAEKGDMEAMFQCGLALYDGDGIDLNKLEASRYFKMSADKGKIESMVKYGMMVLNGDGVSANIEEAVKYLKKAADQEDADGMYEYAILLWRGFGVNVNKLEAARYFKMSADKGKIESMVRYGVMVKNGDGVPVNIEEAAKYMKKPADEGNVEAMSQYGRMLLTGCGYPINKEEAIPIIKTSADKGDLNAIYYYAIINYDGDGIPVNRPEAARYFKLASDKGVTEATARYGRMLKIGDGIPPNKVEAAKYLVKAANNGHAFAMCQYGKMLLEGDGILQNEKEGIDYIVASFERGNIEATYIYAKNLLKDFSSAHAHHFRMRLNHQALDNKYEEAAKLLKFAADKGMVDAMFDYGILIRDGVDYEEDNILPSNKVEAAEYLKQAADAGNAEAMAHYGRMVLEGDGIPINKEEAVRYITSSYENNNAYGIALYASLFNLGIGFQTNKNEAIRLYKIAIERGNPYAMNGYANMLHNGQGIPVNNREAVYYYKMAIEKGYASAMFNYAQMLYNGDGVAVNKKEALSLFLKAANLGNHYAMYYYAKMNYDGVDGVRTYKEEAIKYFKKAARKGNVDAMFMYGYMQMTEVNGDKREGENYIREAANKGNRNAINFLNSNRRSFI